MISAWWLCLIIPVSVAIGFTIACFCTIAKDNDK